MIERLLPKPDTDMAAAKHLAAVHGVGLLHIEVETRERHRLLHESPSNYVRMPHRHDFPKEP